MKRQLVFVLEDDDLTRESLRQKLKHRGFEVVVAANVEKAREVVRRQGLEIDAAVLDMRLDDADHPGVSGADIGLELRRRQAPRTPELMIYSANPSVDYYQQALTLGTSIFLNKSGNDDREVIRHIRALLLRRALSIENPEILDAIKRFADASRDPVDAISRFCRQVLTPELKRTLGAPFTLLLTDHDAETTHPISGSFDLPDNPLPLYQVLQSLIFRPDQTEDIFTVEPEALRDGLHRAGIPDSEQVLGGLRGVRFFPLAETRHARLSLGIAQEDASRNDLAENAAALAQVMSRFFRNSVLDRLITLTEEWSASQLVLKHRGMLRATSQFCLNIGHA